MSIASKVVGLLKGVFGLSKTAAGLKSDNPLLLPDGTGAAPGMAFTSEPNSGWVWATAGMLRLYTSAVNRMQVDTTATCVRALKLDETNQDAGLARAAAGVARFTNGSTGAGGFSSAPNSPAQITADQNNYASGVGLFQRWSSDAARTVTGMVAGQDGEARFVWNVGAQSIVLAHENVSSTAANRFTTSTAASLTVTAGKCALCQYDVVSARWRATLLP